jgi:hypothetical protein
MSNHSGQQTLILATYLLVAKVRERLAVNKQQSHIFHIKRFNLKKLNEVQSTEKYHVVV